MSTVPRLARSYDALRPKILRRLLELRGALDPSLARLDDASACAQLSAVLDHIGNVLATDDDALHRGFLHSFLTSRAGEARSPASALAMLVAIGDTAAQVVQDHDPTGSELTLLLTKVTASTARAVNDLIAEDLAHRMALLRGARP